MQFTNLALIAYPVGSIYMSVNSTNPGTLFGGTWQRITGRFLLAATDGGANGGNSNANVAPGKTGGEATHVLTPGETAMKDHSHSMNHYHGITIGGNGQHWVGGSGPGGYMWGLAAGEGWASTDQFNGNTGGQAASNGSAHNNMPPYLSVYVWKRTA